MANNITLSYPSAFYHQFLDRNGKPLTGGKLYTYSAGTSTSIPTYKTIGDTSSANTNTNPIILDNAGVAHIVIETDKAYKFVLFDKNDAKIDEWDNVTGNIGGGGGSSEDIVVVGTPNEIDVSGSVTQGVKRYVISLSNSVKSTILYLVGLYTNVLNSLGNKADKVQGATAGNLAALDASGNLTDSGSKAADFKTKQTPVADPSASGNGLEFIDSISQNANGEITPHKKSVQDGTTAQKGVVKLSNAIDSTSVTEAATPKAVKDAYDKLNNKIVARAVFLSQAEWAVQSQLPGDPAKVYYVEDGTGEDAYTVYVWKESTSTYEEVDESSIDLDGYWHDGPTTTGDGNVVTNITLGNDGVPQVEKGMSAEPAFSVLPIGKGGTGKDDAKGALNALTSQMQHYDTIPSDETLIVQKFGTSSDANGALYTRPLSKLWTYIQNKISSVLGLTASSYGGNAATATSATTAAGYTNDGAIASALAEKAVSSVYNETDPLRMRSFIKCQGTTNQFYRKLATALEADSGANSSVIKVEGCIGAWLSGDTTDFSIVVRTRNAVKFETNVFKRIGGIYAFEKVDFELYEESNGTYSLWLHSVGTYTVCAISAFAYAGASIVYDGTDGTPTGTLVASASQNYKVMMVTDGDGSNLSVTPDGTSTGYDLGSSTTLKAFAQKFKNLVGALKALAFKDKASYNDLSSGVQSSLDKADSALQSHQSVTDNNPTLSWGTTSKVGKVGSTDLQVTMPANPAQNLPASVITSGTFGAARIPATLPNTGVEYLLPLVHFYASNITASTQYALIAQKRYSGNDERPGEMFRLFYNDVFIDFKTFGLIRPNSQTAALSVAPLQSFGMGETDWTNRLHVTWTNDPSARTIDVNIYFKFNVGENRFVTLYQYNGQAGGDRYNYTWTPYQGIESQYAAAAAGIEATYEWNRTYLYGSALYASKIGSYDSHPQVGSPSTPVYVDSNGQVQPCDVLSGGTSNFNRTFTTTYTVGSTDQYITTLIKNDNTDLIADYVAWHNANYGKLSSPPMIVISVSARDTNVANAGLISLNMYRTGNGCDVFGEKYAYMGNQHGSKAYNTQYFTDQTFVSGSAYYLNLRNETQNTMWAAGTILDISIRIVAHAVSVT